MKTKYYFSLLIITSLLTFSCKKEAETSESSTSAPKEIIMPRVQPLPAETAPNITSVPNQPTTTVTPQAMPKPVVVAKGMNPAHGQPGHRCDIAVGAPLNSPVKSNLATSAPTSASAPYTITQTPTTTTTSVPAPTTPALLNTETTATAPGMNPPHGQAGHTCAVKVGEPLPK